MTRKRRSSEVMDFIREIDMTVTGRIMTMKKQFKGMKCAMCNESLNEKNIGRYGEDDWRAGEVRLDSVGRAWCQGCTDEFDSIDWDEVRN